MLSHQIFRKEIKLSEYKFKTLPTVTPGARWHSACLVYLTPKFQEWLKPNLERVKQTVKENKWDINTLKMRFCFWLECSIYSDYETADFDNLIELYRTSQSLPRGATLEKFTVDYGPIWGPIRWREYCDRQAYTNTFEYKAKTYNMNESEYEHYNKSRASTKKNFISRHGKVEGERLWEEYKERQSYTKSLQYQIDLHGEEEGRKKFAEINAKKKPTLENFINRYGEEEGLKKWQSYWAKRKSPTSDMEREFIDRVEALFTLYENMNSYRHAFFDYENGVYLVDFYNSEFKLVVEFNGNYWHANPKIYSATDKIRKLTAAEIWAREDKRLNFLQNHDKIDKIIVVWEGEEEQGLQEIREYVEKFRKRR
nr:MAG TPA: DNA mismatch endonuclease [Caudoviricetes sp.]